MKRLAVALSSLGVAAALSVASCSEQPVNVPVRTFDRAQKVDFVCLQVLELGDDGLLRDVAPRPVPQEECAPVATGTRGAAFPFHLYALVTQLTRGELAVVDLTEGGVVDVARATPGVNFLPVGAMPTDVAVAPDGVMAFVAAAEPNKAAIYGVPGRAILGDSRGTTGRRAPEITDWPVCALPQRPGAMAIVPRGSTADAGSAAGAGYELAVVLPGEGSRSSKLLLIDPAPFLRGAGPGVAPAELPEGAVIEPGSLVDCPVTAAIELSDERPDTWSPGPAWDDGIPYDFPSTANETPPTEVDGGDGGDAPDGGTSAPVAPTDRTALPFVPACPAARVSDEVDGGAPSSPAESFTLPPDPDAPQGTQVAFDGNVLYVADGALPMIHVVDLSVPGAPKELEPYLATSLVNPQRRVEIGSIAVSPTTRDYKRYLYAVDRKEGSLMVFDATDPATAARVPLSRPHPENNPFQPVDRLSYGNPIVAVSFARHDFTPRDASGVKPTAGGRGLLCNPNPAASNDPGSPEYDPGTLFREGAPNQDPQLRLGAFRLRGIFALVTLANGQVITIDVDDWDAPCRRPADMSNAVSAVTPPQPGPEGLDPYRAPVAQGASNELFFPMSAPNRTRSRYLVRDDPDLGAAHVPSMASRPQLESSGTTIPVSGVEGERNPLLVPAGSALPDLGGPPEVPGVRISWEDPQAHFDQDWVLAYEGVLPTANRVVGTLATTDDYATLTVSQPAGFFCRTGVEDLRVGSARAREQLAQMEASGLTAPALPLDLRTVDYVQVADELLPADDPYWRADNDCWDERPAQEDRASVDRVAAARHETCSATFGGFEGERRPNVFRDYPILEAYDDRLVLGRYGYVLGEGQAPSTSNRVAVPADASNATFMKQLKCCFHNQVRFNVRTGGQWLAVGSAVGVLHHVKKDPGSGACVVSCETRDRLLNARAPAVPAPATRDPALAPDRNSALALRNPMFAFVIYDGVLGGQDVVPLRDMLWRFGTRGAFAGLSISIANQTISVNPQSMRFVSAFQQMAIVDGSSQGLVLIDLNTMAFSRGPFF